MEHEIRNLRTFYEKEIVKLRNEIQATSAHIAKSDMTKRKLEKSSVDLLEQ